MKVSVIMPVWVRNEEIYNLTRNALASLGDVDELIMVDNASPMGGDQFMSVSDIYIRNRENLGYPKAVNQGLALTSGDLIAVSNNDIRVSGNWKEIALKAFEKHESLGSLHFKMQGYDEPFMFGNKVWKSGKERWCTGSFFVWRREAVDEIGGIDEGYGLGGYDDWDWHHRMNHINKWNSGYTNAAAYQHKDSATLKTTGKPWNPENREYFKSKFEKYPEEIWEEKYPDQMKQPYRPFP